MGFFSWKTSDTRRSIANTFSPRPTFKVYMKDDKGNQWEEANYEGYGEFGGKDFYELLDEMNEGDGDRIRGINLFFDQPKKEGVKIPILVEDPSVAFEEVDAPEACEDQGFFYGEEE